LREKEAVRLNNLVGRGKDLTQEGVPHGVKKPKVGVHHAKQRAEGVKGVQFIHDASSADVLQSPRPLLVWSAECNGRKEYIEGSVEQTTAVSHNASACSGRAPTRSPT